MKLTFTPKILKTYGSSMMPILHDQDIIEISKTSFSKLKVNDIVCCKNGNIAITHRIIYKTKTYVITKGDNNQNIDGKKYKKQILGIVKTIKRDGKIWPIDTLYFFQSSIYMPSIIELTSSFEENNINYVILKGLPLHLYYERALPKRIYADCDILIDKNQLNLTRKVFRELGYCEQKSHLSQIQQRKKSTDAEISFFKSINGYPVVFDIHLECVFLMTQRKLEFLFPQKEMDVLTQDMLMHKKQVVIDHNRFKILQNEYLFIYLCLHLFHHNLSGTYRYDLIKQVIKKKLNYYKTSELIEKYNLGGFMYPSIILLQKHYQIKLPYFFTNRIKNDRTIIQKWTVSQINIFNSPNANSNSLLFYNCFVFSSEPIIHKLQVFLDLEVITLILNRFISFLRNKLLIK